MKQYIVTVNGTTYEVTVEEMGAVAPVSTTVSAPAAPAAAPKAAPASPKAAPAAPAGTQGGATKVSAPMPGTVLKINVTVGQAVKSGGSLCVLEAMKMENDIPAPADGTVASINVSNGATVQSGDILITLN